MRASRLAIAAVLATCSLALSACGGGGDPLSGSSKGSSASGGIVVGSADFPESQLLATIYAKALSADGVEATTKLNIGSREVYMPALADGSINMLPEYSGALLSFLDPKTEATTPEDVAAALKGKLPKGTSMLTPSKAQDSDVLAVTKDTADKYSLTSISDLAPHAGELVLGGPPEWKTRHEGVVGLKDVYGLQFEDFKSLDVGGPLSLAALTGGQVQAADFTSTASAIDAEKLVVLKDDKNLFAAQEITPIVATDQVDDKVTTTLDAISAALTTQDLVAMNARLDDKDSVDQVAGDWLKQHDLG